MVVRNPKDYLNVIVLIVKRYIYVTRCLKGKLNIAACIGMIANVKNIEGIIAKKKNRLDIHERKWLTFNEYVSS